MKIFSYTLLIIILMSSCSRNSNKTKEYFHIEKIDETHLDSNTKDINIKLNLSDTINDEIVYSVVEEMPQFGNGWKDINKFILDNTEYPKTAIENCVEGKVFVQIVIDEHGAVTNPQILKGIRLDLDEACINVIKNMPNWKPGKQLGKPVKVRCVIPFLFRLDSNFYNDNIIIPKYN